MNKRIEALMTDFKALVFQDTNSFGAKHGSVIMSQDNFEKFVWAVIEDCCELAREWENNYVTEDCAHKYVDEYIKEEYNG